MNFFNYQEIILAYFQIITLYLQPLALLSCISKIVHINFVHTVCRLIRMGKELSNGYLMKYLEEKRMLRDH